MKVPTFQCTIANSPTHLQRTLVGGNAHSMRVFAAFEGTAKRRKSNSREFVHGRDVADPLGPVGFAIRVRALGQPAITADRLRGIQSPLAQLPCLHCRAAARAGAPPCSPTPAAGRRSALLLPPAAELVVQSDREQLNIAIVGVDCIATKRRGARADCKGLVA